MLDVVADRLLGVRAGDVMGIVSIISIAASISAMTFAGPRVYYAMARDGLFFRGAARVHPRYQTPAASIIAQAVWSGLLVLSGGAQRADDLHRVCGRAVLRHRGRLALRAAPARARCAAALPRVGLSRRARDLRDRQPRHRAQRALGRSRRPDADGRAMGPGGGGHRSSSPWAFPSTSSSAAARRRLSASCPAFGQLSVAVSDRRVRL